MAVLTVVHAVVRSALWGIALVLAMYDAGAWLVQLVG